ncbi:PVC-type heme-binding CxxCH protein [Kriegella aquimaris]|uniref:Putative membrane-bound dehydrogenase domain-containing protein n=1 Tax=Kriegella aquimaris TaxID=192904 RepID=A0A1G9XA60_9FLAO|nr:PVC-type heme-binding CxxCH protein [Kriegella aquimaris]SDM93205.1 putative membrane-bound dehydrogenase domain-containing protein [Kriegella aquimaris]
MKQPYHFKFFPFLGVLILILASCGHQAKKKTVTNTSGILQIKQDTTAGTLSVFRQGDDKVLATQNARPDFRPFLHPIMAPDGTGPLTEYSPGHHKHQTGLYWGFTRVNGKGAPTDTIKKYFYKKDDMPEMQKKIGRDFFHHPDGNHWKRVSFDILQKEGSEVSWQTVYNMLDTDGTAMLQETQIWTMTEKEGKTILNLEWQGKAVKDITIGEFDYGGLFLRMPWKEGIKGEAVNAARQRNEKAEGQRAMWMDVGMQLEGHEDIAHMTIYDHPQNAGFPQPWRVDGQLGVGPVRVRMGDWHIKKGETEIIKHRIVAYTGEHDDLALTALYNDFIGSNSMYSTASLWNIAQEEGRNAKFLKPEEAAAEMTMLAGFEANAWAGEPMITQPIAFCWDDRGRLWVAENRDYESRVDGFSNSGDSRIIILEDTNNDGTADSRKVFLEGIPFPSAIAVGFDGLFLGAPPNLLFVPDKNRDDVADARDIEVLLTGWGIRDRHETINSLHWGPDGWLYGLEGFATPSKIRKPKGKGKIYKHKEAFPENLLEADGVDINGGVWRYHPTKKRFEAVAHGFSNPWGIDYDSKGQLFISACVIPHLFHVIPGGIYHRQGGQHFNPYVYSDIQTIVDHRHRSAHGGARIYQSDAFPEIHQDRLFMANIHEHAVLSDILEPQGSGFVAHHGDDFLLANNAQWIGFSMEIGPSGDIYVLDWHDADICGKEVLNKETGRIFRISPKNSLAEDWEGRYEDLRKLNDEQLVRLQTSKSDWHARRARVILQYRATKGALDEMALVQLKKLFNTGENPDHRLRAMWTLHNTQSFSSEALEKALTDSDEYVRAWAIQMRCEDKDASTESLETLIKMSATDPSAVVRLYLAAALQRIDEGAKWKIVQQLISKNTDSEDHNIPKMIWYGMEDLVTKEPAKALDLLVSCQLPQIAEFISRRLVDADQLDLVVGATTKYLGQSQSILKGILSGLEGRSDIIAPKNWGTVYAKLKTKEESAPLALKVAQLFGDTEAAKQFLATLNDTDSPIQSRIDALQGLASKQRKELVAILPFLLNEPELRLQVIRAMAAFDHEPFGRLLIDQFEKFNTKEQGEALQTLASRGTYGRLLTQAIKDEAIQKNAVPAYVARQLRRVVGNGFVEVWGPIDQLSNDKSLAYRRYEKLLTQDVLASPDLNNGKAMFERTCSACHKLFDNGASIGPDLTGSNRTDIDYLLNNLIEPSSDIQDDYRMVVITSRDGRTFSGNIIAENERQLTLRVIGQDQLVLNKSDIQSQEVSAVSMMPEGLLETMSDKEIIDLLAYLQKSEPSEL